jgi:hypothetical protein
MKQFKVIVDTGFSGATYEDEAEFTDEEWEAMSEKEREEALFQACQAAIGNYIEAYTEEIT